MIEVLQEATTISELSKKYGVTSKTIQRWKREFINKAPSLFETDKTDKIQQEEVNCLIKENLSEPYKIQFCRATVEGFSISLIKIKKTMKKKLETLNVF